MGEKTSGYWIVYSRGDNFRIYFISNIDNIFFAFRTQLDSHIILSNDSNVNGNLACLLTKQEKLMFISFSLVLRPMTHSTYSCLICKNDVFQQVYWYWRWTVCSLYQINILIFKLKSFLVSRMEEMTNPDILFGEPDWKYYFQNIRSQGRMILKHILKLKYQDVDWTQVVRHRIQ
jgi:hypothetical protein